MQFIYFLKSVRRHDTDKPGKIYRLEFGPKALNVSTEMLKNNETRTSPLSLSTSTKGSQRGESKLNGFIEEECTTWHYTGKKSMAILELLRRDTNRIGKGIIYKVSSDYTEKRRRDLRNMHGTKPTSGVSKLGKIFRALPQML